MKEHFQNSFLLRFSVVLLAVMFMSCTFGTAYYIKVLCKCYDQAISEFRMVANNMLFIVITFLLVSFFVMLSRLPIDGLAFEQKVCI